LSSAFYVKNYIMQQELASDFCYQTFSKH